MKPSPLNSNIPPYVKGSDTSKAAAVSMKPHTPTLRVRVYEFIAAQRWRGATDDEIEVGCSLTHQTASARRRELEQMGGVFKTAERRKTRSGRTAGVYRAVPGFTASAPVGRPPIAPANSRTVKQTVYLTRHQAGLLKAMARDTGVPVSQVARQCLGTGYATIAPEDQWNPDKG